jgi:hypothetical protein
MQPVKIENIDLMTIINSLASGSTGGTTGGTTGGSTTTTTEENSLDILKLINKNIS